MKSNNNKLKMKYKLIVLLQSITILFATQVRVSQQTVTGIAFSANEKVIQNSKTAILNYMT